MRFHRERSRMIKEKAMEIIVILHTESGDVRTAFPVEQSEDAMSRFMGYVFVGKRASMITEPA